MWYEVNMFKFLISNFDALVINKQYKCSFIIKIYIIIFIHFDTI